jgi:hypothetical protein
MGERNYHHITEKDGPWPVGDYKGWSEKSKPEGGATSIEDEEEEEDGPATPGI